MSSAPSSTANAAAQQDAGAQQSPADAPPPVLGAPYGAQTAKQWGMLALYVILALLMTAVAVTISLMWNAAFQHWITRMPWSKQTQSKFIVAAVATVVGTGLVLLMVFVAAVAGVTIPTSSIISGSSSGAA